MVSRELPFARREGVRLLKEPYESQDDAVRAIERGLRSFYDSRGGSTDQQALARDRDSAPGCVSPERLSYHEGDVGLVSR